MSELVITDANFDKEVLQHTVPVLVDFGAEWCTPCTMIEPIISEIANDYDNRIKVCKLNVDENPKLASRYQIRSIPTLLIFNNGKIVEQLVGVQPKDKIIEKINNYL
ncbi:MAG: thioredoxin [Candidatus Cloacimonadota bacterium]|nr:MAG: thioredoxin [Candidatus Cloacimonadota bacterium]